MIKMQRLILGDLKILVIFFVIVLWISPLWAQPPKKPVIVNGDRVEFLQEEKAISAEGNVEVIYEDTKLTCNKIRVNT